jgi:hypothetical protein
LLTRTCCSFSAAFVVPQRFDLQLQPGDIIVTGSDGLWDNIFAEEAATIASKCRDKGETATTAAQVLCRCARQLQMHTSLQSCHWHSERSVNAATCHFAHTIMRRANGVVSKVYNATSRRVVGLGLGCCHSMVVVIILPIQR